jgi:phosphohistidine phosphatase
MRRLMLFRHAEAVHSSACPDHDRPLTPAGRLKATRVGAFLAETRQRVELVVISDSARTRESWELARIAFGETPETRIEKKIYHADRRDLMAMARALPDSIESLLFVGHNPAMAEFAMHFAGAGDHEALQRLVRGFPPGGLAIFGTETDEWRKLRWGGGELIQFLT